MKKSKKSAKRENKGWNQIFTWKKSPKVEPTRDSIHGSVMQALKKLKSGTVAEIEAEALRQGLAKHTQQNYRVQTQVMLRRLVKAGAATKAKGETPAPKTATKLVLKKKTKEAAAAA